MASINGYVLASLLLLAAACCSHAITVVDTTNKNFLGFVLDRDVTTYRNYTIDAQLVLKYLAARNYAAANTVYTTGASVRSKTGVLRNLKTVGNTVRSSSELFFKKASSFYKTPTQSPVSYIEMWMGTSITAASSVQKVTVGLQWIQLSFVGHELDVAYNVVGTASGASVATGETVDGFGLWYGYPDAESLYKFWVDVDRWGPGCAGSTAASTAATFIKLRTAAIANNAASYRAAYNTFFDVNVPTVYLRAIMYASGRVQRSAGWQTLASGYLKIIQPLLNGAAKPIASTLQTLLSSRALAPVATVKTHVTNIANRQGIPLRNTGIC